MDPLNRTIPLKKRQEPRRREGINRRENRIGKPGGGPQAKEDHCREIGKSWQNRNKGPGIQHPLGGRGALVCNHIQNAWDVDRNKENVLLMTRQKENPRGCVQRRGKKGPILRKQGNYHTICMGKRSAMEREWRNSRENEGYPTFPSLKSAEEFPDHPGVSTP